MAQRITKAVLSRLVFAVNSDANNLWKRGEQEKQLLLAKPSRMPTIMEKTERHTDPCQPKNASSVSPGNFSKNWGCFRASASTSRNTFPSSLPPIASFT
jgi:hypothetical protein